MDYEAMVEQMLAALRKQQDRIDARAVMQEAVRLYMRDPRAPSLKEAVRAATEALRDAQARVSLT